MLSFPLVRIVRSHSVYRALIALALICLVVASGPLLSSHLLQDNADRLLSSLSPVEACQPGDGHGLVPDHSLLVEPIHLCVICKVFNGALDVGTSLTVPLFTTAASIAFSHGERLHFAGFFRLSRSPPALS